MARRLARPPRHQNLLNSSRPNCATHGHYQEGKKKDKQELRANFEQGQMKN